MNFYKEISERFTQVFQRCKYFLPSKQVCPSHMSFHALLNLKKLLTHAKVIWIKCHSGRNVGSKRRWNTELFWSSRKWSAGMHHNIRWKASSPISPPGPQLPPQSSTHPRQATAISPFWMRPRKPLVGCTSGRKWLMYRLGESVSGGGMHRARTSKCLCQASWCLADETQTTHWGAGVRSRKIDAGRSLETLKLRQQDTESGDRVHSWRTSPD